MATKPIPVNLTDEQVRVLSSMGLYWEEIKERDNGAAMARNEIGQMLSVISPMDTLLIVLHYAKTYPL